MKWYWFCFLWCFLLSSCSLYQSHFDCPPGKGIGCKSVTEIESMVTETANGPDLFLGAEAEGKRCTCSSCANRKCSETIESTGVIKRVWLEGYGSTSGNRVDGHYVYFALEEFTSS